VFIPTFNCLASPCQYKINWPVKEIAGMVATRALKSTSKTEEVYVLLRADLLASRIAPGSRIHINELTSRLDVSLGAVREALSRLSAEGLVSSEPQKGFRAAPISESELRDLTQVRIKIECLCLESSLRRAGVDWEGNLLAASHRLARTPMRAASDPERLSDEWTVLHSQFHEALVNACDSTWLLRIRRMLYEQSERYRRLSFPFDHGNRDVVSEHKALCAAAVARDRKRVQLLMVDHLQKTTDIIAQALTEEE
jgi:DNA-binding GntR family transcriptional regulator